MKYFLLQSLAKRLGEFSTISKARRIDNNKILLEFDFVNKYILDLTKSQSNVIPIDNIELGKEFNAPFDVNLKKLLTKAKIEKVEVEEGNRILIFYLKSPQVYKEVEATIRFEFTGRHTNCILLNNENIVTDALRHISKETSSREIMPGKPLATLPSIAMNEKIEKIENIDIFLKNLYQNKIDNSLNEAKESAINKIKKRQQKILEHLDSLQNPEQLLEESKLFREWAEILYGRLEELEDFYAKEIETTDFDGKKIKIKMPEESINAKDGARILHQKSKKLSQKAKNLIIEEENLKEKIILYNRMIYAIKEAKSTYEISFYHQKQETKQQKSKKSQPKNYLTLSIDGFDVLVGRNSSENIEVLRDSKSEDMWLHIQDIPSSHVVIKTNKSKLSENLLTSVAKICVNYSISQKGSFLVDYTQRKYVNIIEGSNVTYKNQKSLRIYKE